MADKKRKPTCPKCGEAFDIVTRYEYGTTMTVKASVREDAVLPAESLATLVSATSEMLKAAAEEHGAKISVSIKSVEYQAGDPECSVTLLVCRAIQEEA